MNWSKGQSGLSCVFCNIVSRRIDAVMLHETENTMTILDYQPIREGHSLILAKECYDSFDSAPVEVVHEMVGEARALTHRLKDVFGVDKVAFMFVGECLDHLHAHVLPVHSDKDVISMQYITAPNHQEIKIDISEEGLAHLRRTPEQLRLVQDKIGVMRP